MEKKPDSNPKLLHVIIPAATTLLVAIIGLGTAIYQTEKPIQLTEVALTAQAFTQTAAAPTFQAQATHSALEPTVVAQTVAAAITATVAALPSPLPSTTLRPAEPSQTPTPISNATQSDATISISNKLDLPIKIYIDDAYISDLDAGGYRTLTMDHSPVSLTWDIVKQTTLKGMPLGHDMGGTFTDVKEGDEIIIDNLVVDQPYFYPIVSNTTGTDCSVTINKGWKSEFVTGAIVGAHQNNIGFGYYELYTNSNVTLDCAGEIYWWGQKSDETNGTSFFNDVEKDTGTIYFTLKP